MHTHLSKNRKQRKDGTNDHLLYCIKKLDNLILVNRHLGEKLDNCPKISFIINRGQLEQERPESNS